MLHTSNEDFTQEQIYEFAGVNDYTANITLQPGSDSAENLELRKPKVLEVSSESEGKGKDIDWMYGVFCRYIAKGAALMPEEYAEYLAYKMIIEYDQFTKDERDEIFTEKGVLLHKIINGFHERRYNGVGKHLNPDNRCFCKGSQAYYYNGDYYDIDVHPDGHIASFYKREK